MLSIHLKEEGNAFHYAVLEGVIPIASLRGHYVFDGKVMAIQDWEGEVDRGDVQEALSRRVFADCTARHQEVVIHLTPVKQVIYETFCKYGFKLHYENLLFRTLLDNPTPPEKEITLIPAMELSVMQYAELFHACNIGNPKEPHVLIETPAAFWKRYILELADLYVPELVFAAQWQGQTVGVLHFRVVSDQVRIIGYMNYIGIHPDFRGRGLGMDLHKLGLHYLHTLGCTEYIGSTPDSNHAMQQVFARNQVPLWAKQVFLK
jgi:GNAT superfamily N-acetyltransferase